MFVFGNSSSRSAMAQHSTTDKNDLISSERTTPLEEDENMFDEEEDHLSHQQLTETVDEPHHHDIPSGRARRVTFTPMTSHYLVMPLDEYTQDEIEKAFWTPKQMEVLTKAKKRIVARMEAGLEEKASSPYRGMEKLTLWGYRHARKATNAYFNTVMDEMDRQRKESKNGLLDWETIASLTEELTKRSKEEALLIALRDENAARAAYESIEADTTPQQQSKSTVSKSSRLPFSGCLRQVRAGLTSKVRKPLKATSGTRRKNKDHGLDRLETIIRMAEGQDYR